ncbi:MAG TPA: biotin transporter BioY [Afifellaceae bacterium]|nr:biotin transporter BioY [Afifellaceae bacterium]
MSAAAARGPLVGRFIPDEGAARLAAYVGLAIAGTLLLWLSAKVKVPFWPVPMTMQTFMVLALAAAYGFRLGTATVLLYLFEGAVGLPVFTGTPEQGIGLAYLAGPTGGYLIAYPLAAALVGWFVERGYDRRPVALFGVMLAGDAVIFALGFAWLAWIAALPSGSIGLGAEAAFAAGVAPFLLGDLVKVALAASLIPAAGRLVRRG